MTRTYRRLLTGLMAVMLPLAASAQEVRTREAQQQGRIGQGVGSGQITGVGAVHLENREARINASRSSDLAAHGGHLTAGEYRSLNHRETSLSRRIHADKHNDVAQPGIVPR